MSRIPHSDGYMPHNIVELLLCAALQPPRLPGLGSQAS